MAGTSARKTKAAWRGTSDERGDQFRKTIRFAESNYGRLVPLERGKATRQPNWWDNAVAPIDITRKQFDGVNIGLANGYGNLVDVDFDDDSPSSIRLASRIFPAATASFGRGRRVTHRLYRVASSIKTQRFKSPKSGVIIEIRCKGTQTMAPGSVHPETQEVIKWFDESQPRRISSLALIRRVQKYAAGCLIARHWVEGQRHDLAAALIGTLIRHTDWSDRRIDGFVRDLSFAANDPDERANAKYERARIGSDSPAFGRKNLKEILGKDYTPVAKWLSLGRQDESEEPDDLFASIGATATEYLTREVPVEAEAISGLLSERKIALLHGSSGSGKSLLLAFFVNALGSGTSVAGWNVNRPYKVLYIESEMDESEFHGRAKRILAANSNVVIIRPSEWDEKFGTPGPFIDRPEDQRRLEKILQLQKIDILAIEPLSWILDVAEETSNDDTKLWAPWFRKLKNFGITVISAHNEGWAKKRVRGASRIVDSVDLTFAVVERSRGKYTLTRGKARTSRPMTPNVVQLLIEEGPDNKLVLRRAYDKRARQVELLRAWRNDPSVSLKDLANRFGVDQKTISRDVNELEKKGLIETSGRHRLVTDAGIAQTHMEDMIE